MFEIAILSVISVLVSGCDQKKSKVKDVVRDTDNKEVKNIEEIKKRFKLKDVKDLIFIPIKKNRCIVWNNYYYRHAVFSNSPRLMLGPVNETIQGVGDPVVKGWRKAYTDLEDNLIPIRYGKNHDVCFHHDSNPKTKKINELSMLVYLEDIDEGYFILEKSKECGKVYVDGDPRLASQDFLDRLYVVAGLNGKPADIWEDLEIDKEYVECGGKIINIKKNNYCITKLELGSDFNKNIKKIKKSFDDETKWSEDRFVKTHLPSLGGMGYSMIPGIMIPYHMYRNNKEECKNAQMESDRPFDVYEDEVFSARGDVMQSYRLQNPKVSIDEEVPDPDQPTDQGELLRMQASIPEGHIPMPSGPRMLGPDSLKNIGKWSKRPNNNFVYLYEDKDNKITKKLKGKLDNCDITFI